MAVFRKGAAGQPMGIAELVVVATLEKLGTAGGISNVALRGVPAQVLRVRPPGEVVAQPGEQAHPLPDSTPIQSRPLDSRASDARAARPPVVAGANDAIKSEPKAVKLR